MRQYSIKTFSDFRCLHCGYWVTSNRQFSGVNHRNHCPYCLWSRHLDLYQAGDRMSACKSGMRPVGLAMKKTSKKYADDRMGELMVVHLCMDCGKLTANRIAADDDVDTILAVYTDSIICHRFDDPATEMILLNDNDSELVYQQLLGCITSYNR